MNPAEPKLPGNRTFGFFFAAVFSAAGLYTLYLGANPYACGAFAVAAVLLLLALVKAGWFKIPRVGITRLNGMQSCYKIKLYSADYRPVNSPDSYRIHEI